MKVRNTTTIILLLCSYILLGCRPTAATEADNNNNQPQSETIESTAQFDTYAEWVENWLTEEHDLAIGNWLFEEERVGLENFRANKVQSKIVSVQNKPFDIALRLQTDKAQNLPWNSGITARTTEALQQGDNVLLTFWIRALASEADRGVVTVAVQKTDTFESTISELIPVTESWQQITLRGTAPLTTAANETILFFGTGAQTQQLEIGGIALLNYGNSVSLVDLPQMDLSRYPGQEADAAWRADAAGRIERYRKADINIVVVDSENRPIEDASINIEMQNHAFGFGTAVNANELAKSTRDAAIYRQRLLDLDGKGRGFNRAVLENGLKWPRWESADETYRENAIAAIDWLHSHDIQVRGHNLIWPGWPHMPNDLEENQDDPAYLFQRTQKRIASMLTESTLNERLYEWDVLNEPRTNSDIADAINGNARSGEQIYETWYKLASESDSSTKLFINDYGMLSDAALLVGQHNHYKYFIQALIDNGNHLGGIGLQSHLDYPLAGPERMYTMLNDFAKYNKDIVITEYDISLRYRNEADLGETTAGAYTRDFLTIIFSHPSVSAFMMWGYWDEIHWQDDSPIYRADWSIKPAGQAFIDLVFDEWWTNERGVTDATGSYQTKGFLGEYKITVTVDDTRKTVNATITADGETIKVLFDGTETPFTDASYSINLPYVSSQD